jgi:hypothetical protein
MQIEEVSDATRAAAEAAKQEENNGFTFVIVPSDLKNVFPNF